MDNNPAPNSPLNDDYDKIRAKRLAKMMGTSSNGASEAPSQSAASVSSSSAIKPPVSSKPIASPAVASAAGPATPPSAARQVTLFATVTEETWAHQTLAFIFQIDLNAQIAEQKGSTYLPDLVQELQQDGLSTTFLSFDTTDRIIHSRLSQSENSQATAIPLFDYLVGAWKRCREAHRRVLGVVEKAQGLLEQAKVKQLAERRIGVLVKTRELVVSYSGLVVNPDLADMYPQCDTVSSQGAGYIASKLLLDGFAAEEQLPAEFLAEFVQRFENDGLAEIMGPVINGVTAAMRFQDISTDFMTPLRALSSLIANKSIATILISMPNFLPPNTTARTFELLTILGPYFAKPAVFDDDQGKLGKTYFASANPFGESSNRDREGQDLGTRNFGDVESAITNLRGTISSVQSVLHNLVMQLIKTGPEYRESVLKFLADAITSNHARGRLQVDPKTVGTDGFLFNIGKVCLLLSDPITDPGFSKIHLIEPFHFLRSNQRLPQPPSTTLMNADDEYLDAQKKLGNFQGVNVIPFPAEVPSLFATLPEWIFEDIVEFYLFICRFQATLLENTLRDELLLFTVGMLRSPTYVKNPHLKSKLVEILFYFTLPLYRTQSGEATGPRLDLVFSTHDAAKKHLVPGIMRHYVDAEFTGDSRAFYDKFNIRYNISQILKAVWEDQNHRLALIEASQKEDFIKFANLLMNDTSYLLDESLSKLSEIHKLQIEMDDASTWNSLAQTVREEKEKTLRDLERGAQSYIQLGTETVNMLRYLTSEERVVTPFMAPYIVERLAAMLDYNLTTLAGPKCADLKVKNPEKYRFNPKSLLTKLVDIYLNLAHRSEFVNAVAKDERSYRKDVFARAADILSRYGLKNSRDLDELHAFVKKVEDVIRNTQVEEEELGDIPDEFLDPLMASLMEDPVILPTSNITVDRSTIITQLLSNPLDPFNRKPLTIDMVIPNVELKQQIEAWRKQQKSGNVTPMETD
ncbi:hypothetical protein HDU99_001175 [Rhizoclosmatium hyalinum]|nr:hypothetical protein HDU99_001175 [Rhizoclosmatium hyalinum]